MRPWKSVAAKISLYSRQLWPSDSAGNDGHGNNWISSLPYFWCFSFLCPFLLFGFHCTTIPLYSLCTEYQISSFDCTFKKGFPTFYKGDSRCSRGEKDLQKPRSSFPAKPPDNGPQQPGNTEAEAQRIFCSGAGFTGSVVSELLLTPNQDRVTSWALNHSSNTLPPSRPSCWSQYQDKCQNYLGIPHWKISTS